VKYLIDVLNWSDVVSYRVRACQKVIVSECVDALWLSGSCWGIRSSVSEGDKL
jgi:hypothetical protein